MKYFTKPPRTSTFTKAPAVNRGRGVDIIYLFFYNIAVILHNQRAVLARSRGSRVAVLIVLALTFTAGCTSAMEPTQPKSMGMTPPRQSPQAEPVTPTDPPNTNPIIDFSKPLKGYGDDLKVWANMRKELPLIASTLGIPKAYEGKPESASVPLHYDVVAPLGKHCLMAMQQNPRGSTMYQLVVLSRYNTMLSTVIPDPLELTDLKEEVNHWKRICDFGKYQPLPGEIPTTEPTETVEAI